MRVLMFAYACEPNRGSEPGAGWALVETVRKFADITVLVSSEHRPAIEQMGPLEPAPGREAPRFVFVDEASWTQPLRTHRIPWFGAYLLWLREARKVAERLVADEHFDVVHHATYSVYWLPTPAVDLGVPSVVGPIGGAVETPLRLWPLLGLRGTAEQLVDLAGVAALSRMRSVKEGWAKASALVLQNEGTLERLPADVRSHATVLNHALFTQADSPGPTEPGDHLLWVSSVEPRKGPLLAVRALAHADPAVRLTMIGDGPQMKAVQRLAAKLKVDDRLDLQGRLPREELFSLMASSRGVVSTGLREEGGLALSEALVVGVPVALIAHGGPVTITEEVDPAMVRRVELSTIDETAARLGEAMTDLFHEPRPRSVAGLIDQRDATRRLQAIFAQVSGKS